MRPSRDDLIAHHKLFAMSQAEAEQRADSDIAHYKKTFLFVWKTRFGWLGMTEEDSQMRAEAEYARYLRGEPPAWDYCTRETAREVNGHHHLSADTPLTI